MILSSQQSPIYLQQNLKSQGKSSQGVNCIGAFQFEALSPRNRISAYQFYHLHSSSVTEQKSLVSSQKNPRYLEKSPIYLQENLESQDKSSHEILM